MASAQPFLAFAHIGDLHVSDGDPAHMAAATAAIGQINGDRGRRDVDVIGRVRRADEVPAARGIRSDALGAREAEGLLGTRLGPGRNGRGMAPTQSQDPATC